MTQRWPQRLCRWLIGGVTVLAISALAGCTTRQGASGRPKMLMPVSAWPGYAYMALAHERGFDTAAGVELDLRDYADPSLIVGDLAWGRLPVAQLTTVEVVDLCARQPKRCPEIILVLDESRGGEQLIARPAIRSVNQLKGKRVGLNPTTLGPYVLIRALQSHGLTAHDVEVLTINMGEMAAALAQGKVDAVATFPPFSLQAQREANGRVIFDSSQMPGEIFDVLVVERHYLHEHRHHLAAVLKAWQQAHTFARTHPDAATPLLARQLKLAPSAFGQANRGLVYVPLAQQQTMLRPKGLIQRNLVAMRKAQLAMGLIPGDGALPQVNASVVELALQ